MSKKDKENSEWEYRDKAKDREKAKSHILSTTNQPQIQDSKKRHGGQRGNRPVKNKKNKAKDLSYIKCYTFKQKGHYANKCPDKPKN